MASELVKYDSQVLREDDPLARSHFKVTQRVVDKRGNGVSRGDVLKGVTEAKALDFIKAEQCKFERSGHNKEFDYFWGANAAAPGCCVEHVSRWTIERSL